MGGKKGGENTKKVAGNAKKAEAAAQKASAAQAVKDKEEAAEWAKGAKNEAKKKAEADKKAEQAAKKEEARKLLEAEEASQPSKPKGANKKVAEKKTRGLDLGQLDGDDSNPQSALNASGIDNALDALSLTASQNDLKIDRHPERRKEAAYQAYAAWREEELKGSGLRRDQRISQMRKEFEKRPENPMNQLNALRYDATKEEIAEHKQSIAAATENRLTGK